MKELIGTDKHMRMIRDLIDNMTKEDGNPTDDEEGQEPEHGEIKRDAGAVTTSDLSGLDHIDELATSLMYGRVAKGEAHGMECVVKATREASEKNLEWVIKVHMTRVIEERYDDRFEEWTPSETLTMNSTTTFDNPGQLYLEFEHLVDKFDLDEITNPEEHPDGLDK